MLLDELVGTLGKVEIERITMLPPDRGASARMGLSLAEEVKGATGLDVGQLVEGFVKR